MVACLGHCSLNSAMGFMVAWLCGVAAWPCGMAACPCGAAASWVWSGDAGCVALGSGETCCVALQGCCWLMALTSSANSSTRCCSSTYCSSILGASGRTGRALAGAQCGPLCSRPPRWLKVLAVHQRKDRKSTHGRRLHQVLQAGFRTRFLDR